MPDSEDSLAAYLDDSNTLGHLTGYILTSQPLTKGGMSPYDAVPTCLLQSADHLFHDEVCSLLCIFQYKQTVQALSETPSW